jgi:DNA-binding NtrC family response regulator
MERLEKLRNGAARILVVEDDENLRMIISDRLSNMGYSISQASSLKEAIGELESEICQLVLLDIFLPDQSGLEGLRKIRELLPSMPVIVMTAHGTIDMAVEAMRDGAYEFVTKPLDFKHLEVLVQRAIERFQLRTEIDYLRRAADEPFTLLVGEKTGLKSVMELVRQVADSDTSVLLRGETGTGKEVIARQILKHSARVRRPFIVANCAAIPKELMESEMFGHVKGSFTGAFIDHAGVFEAAGDGTLLLDEIGDLDYGLQAKILRVLEDGSFRKVGGRAPQSSRARILASTHQNLEKLIEEKSFREDLYYRLNVFPITIPPLRHRRDDIPDLARSFLSTADTRSSGVMTEIDDGGMDVLINYPWPGNVRELKNLIERMAITVSGKRITADNVRRYLGDRPLIKQEYDVRTLAMIEKEAIIATLDYYSGNRTKAAMALGISRRGLQNKLKSYGMADYGNSD